MRGCCHSPDGGSQAEATVSALPLHFPPAMRPRHLFGVRTPDRVAFAFCLLFAPGLAAAQIGEATPSAEPLLRGRDVAWLGAGTALSIAVMQFDSRIARELQRQRDNPTLQEVADVFSLINEKSLAAAGVLTYAGARMAKARATTDIALHTTEAIVASSTTSTLIRGILGRSRPFVTSRRDAFDYHYGEGFRELRYRAFPSIHSSAAFSTAAAVSEEMRVRRTRGRKVLAPLFYTVAAGPGLARMYSDKHWASDVVMGAALGTLAGLRSVRYAHGHPANRLDRIFLGVTRISLGRGGSSLGVSLPFAR